MRNDRSLSVMLLTAVSLLFAMACQAPAADPPNIVLIYGDDVGYGDVACYGGSIATPNLDQLAAEGLRHTDAHCSAATCTPSRYALLTGSYAFRGKRTGIQPGNANLIIQPKSATLPERLKSAGYTTGVVGKWHLGLGDGPIDWNGKITPGPESIGFDYHFLIPATGDRVPCVYVEQGRVVDLAPADPIEVSYGKRIGDAPIGKERPDLLKMQVTHGHDRTIVNGISRIGYMTGGEQARWVDEDMADVITSQAVKFIERNKEKPFFLYFASHDIHVPRVPHSRFAGTTGHGPRGDAMAQLDWCVGEVMKTLKQHGLEENTLVIFSSDNGPVLDDGYADQANELLGDHRPAADWRAGKYSKFEGGTRVPTIVRWPARIPANTTSDALVGQIDWAHSLASLAGASVEEGTLVDSLDQLPALLGEDSSGRTYLAEEANGLSLRQGQWKYVTPGRVTDKLGPWNRVKVTPPGALYDLASDPQEQTDVASENAERVEQMQSLLERIKQQGDAAQ
ncbi:sulfatase family protein [Aeoliella mucimassa]|uniref:Arylsulfatase n=1 Tax=Aeoliella mucimassa TaxID=2527972 RepID=A0A518ARK8_9BACT|nr:arylsulfatase [Aeoliella mucimassa]QDU57352.1 Arylsulfatase [Aeoliella mucimassa]